MQSFEAEIVEVEGGGAFVRVPDDVVAALGGKGRIPVEATFDGVAYRGSVVSMGRGGGGGKVLGVLKGIRAELGKQPGDTVADDLRTALDAAGLADKFTALSYSHQREYVTWIDEAKKPDTRARRIAGTVDRLRS